MAVGTSSFSDTVFLWAHLWLSAVLLFSDVPFPIWAVTLRLSTGFFLLSISTVFLCGLFELSSLLLFFQRQFQFCFLSTIAFRHLSSRFKVLIMTFEGCTETNMVVPSTFSRVNPSTKMRYLFRSTREIFPSNPSWSPRIIRTVSPFRTGRVLRPLEAASSGGKRSRHQLVTQVSRSVKSIFRCFPGSFTGFVACILFSPILLCLRRWLFAAISQQLLLPQDHEFLNLSFRHQELLSLQRYLQIEPRRRQLFGKPSFALRSLLGKSSSSCRVFLVSPKPLLCRPRWRMDNVSICPL